MMRLRSGKTIRYSVTKLILQATHFISLVILSHQHTSHGSRVKKSTLQIVSDAVFIIEMKIVKQMKMRTNPTLYPEKRGSTTVGLDHTLADPPT